MELRLCKRTDGLFEAYDDETAKQKIPVGEVISLPYSAKRNYKNLQCWHVFCKHTFDMQDTYDNLRVWKKILCIAAGHCDMVIDKKGNTQFLPSSISYKECDDEHVFIEIFARAINWFLDTHSNGMTDREFMRILDYE